MEPQIPNIHAMSAESIFEALRDRIPRYLREWDDYNESDPGIALLQLYAVMGEAISHQLSRLPEALHAEMLSIVGLKPAPALSARAVLSFTAASRRAGPVGVPQGAQVAAPGPDGRILFETTAGLSLVKTPLAMVMAFDGVQFMDVTQDHEDTKSRIKPFGAAAPVGASLMLGFEPDGAGGNLFPEELRFHLFKPPTAGAPPASNADPILVPPVRLIAEYRNDPAQTGWQRLDIVEDETVAFLRSGAIRIDGPGDSVATAERPGDDPLHWIRLRIASGGYGAGQAPEIDALMPNAVTALQQATERDVFLAEGTGLPDQVHALRRTPVISGSVNLVDDEGTIWREVQNLAEAGPLSPVYELDPGEGTLTFGDGDLGLIPGAGLQLFARSYRHGGGTAGNVPADQITQKVTTLGGVEEVTNRLPAQGGADAQTPEHLARNAPRLVGQGCLFTAEDFEREARRAPQVARAAAIPAFHPDYPALDTPGVVTLLILPKDDDVPAPAPDDALLAAILANIEPRRPLGMEVLAAGPIYRPVAVDTTVDVAPSASLSAVQAAIAEALDAALSPLQWPFGLDFRPAMLIGAIQNVPGVLGVARFEAAVDGIPVDDPTEAVPLARNEIVAPAPHTVFARYGEDR